MHKIRYLIFPIGATIFYLLFCAQYDASKVNSLFFIPILWVLPLLVQFGNYTLEKEVIRQKHLVDEKIEKKSCLLKKLEEVKNEKVYLERKLIDISRLYAISKDMSCDVHRNELFASLGSFLEDNFKYDAFSIALITQSGKKSSIEPVYRIYKSKKEEGPPNEIEKTVIGRTIKSFATVFAPEKKLKQKIAHFSAEEEKHILGQVPKIENVLGIPLIVKKHIRAVFVIMNIDQDDYERFVILASQVALQIERIRLFEEVERLSITDGLTDTYLRRYLMERFAEELARAKESKLSLSFIMADLDYFKRCNDSFGHLVGDAVLREIAYAIKKNVREIDLVARFGGEEFLVLLPEADKKGALIVAERIRKAIDTLIIKAYDESIDITISMGISSFPEDGDLSEELIEKADKALYEAKNEGRNRVITT